MVQATQVTVPPVDAARYLGIVAYRAAFARAMYSLHFARSPHTPAGDKPIYLMAAARRFNAAGLVRE